MDMCTGIPLKSAGHPLAANPCTELEDRGGRQQVEMEGGWWEVGGAGPASAPGWRDEPTSCVLDGKQGNGSADVSILRTPREGG